MEKIAIIGNGNVGNALARGLKRAGYEVRATGRENVRETAAWGDVIILAVPFAAVEDAVRTMADAVNGKVLVDVTNALDDNMALAVGCTTSGAEQLQSKATAARVVKAFNTNFAQHMDTGHLADQPLTVFAASDHDEARKTVMDLASAIGFDAVSAGPLQNARWLETLGLSEHSTRVRHRTRDCHRIPLHSLSERPIPNIVLKRPRPENSCPGLENGSVGLENTPPAIA